VAATDLKLVEVKAKRKHVALGEFHAAIRQAHASGESLRKIGEAAGISHVRVLQIVRGE
jgi:hypothetical protein